MSNSAIHEQGAFDVALLEASFAAIAPEAERLVARFYEELFKRDASIRSVHANTDMSRQKPKLLAALKLVIANVRNPDELLPALREMGQRHESYGVTPAQYSVFADVLLSVLADIVGDKWTEQEQNAWTGALTMVAETMISAYTGTGAAASNETRGGPPGGVERRSQNRPWSSQMFAADGDSEPFPVERRKMSPSHAK